MGWEMAWLSQYKAKDKVYVYLQEYTSSDETSKKCRNIFSFGRKDRSLQMLNGWLKDFPSAFPLELIELGFGKEDLMEWINTLETGVTKTGRSTKFKAS